MAEPRIKGNHGSYRLSDRSLPVAADVDVLVAGGGPAGFGAALAAARQGASTLLVERNAILGGTSTAGGMNVWNMHPDNMTGIAREVTLRLIDAGAAIAGPRVPFDAETLKHLELSLLEEAGADILTYTWVVEPLLVGDRIEGALVVNKSGLQAVRAKVVVDATGDADLAASAGAPVVRGREKDAKMRPMTVLFRLGGVDVPRLVAYAREHPEQFHADTEYQNILNLKSGLVRICGFFDVMEAARARGEIDGDLNYIRFEGVQVDRGIVTVNNSRVYDMDGTNGWDVSRGDIEARRQNRQLFAVIKNYLPGCENAYMLDSSMLGVRETRRVRGKIVLTEEDILAHRTYPDTVAKIWRARAPGHDSHNPDGGEGTAADADHRTVRKHLDWFEIPYGAFMPSGVEGLLVGGRILSQTHMADNWTRGQYCCMVTGQVAGTAGALAAASGVLPRNVDVRNLQEILTRSGVDIGEAGRLAPVGA